METSEGPRATEPETLAGDRPPRYGSRNGLSYLAAAIETRRSLLLNASIYETPWFNYNSRGNHHRSFLAAIVFSH